MTRLVIRKSGGANIISIPKAVLKVLGLHADSAVDMALEGNRIILTPVEEKMTLQDVLAGSPKERLVSAQDRQWLEDDDVGKEED